MAMDFFGHQDRARQNTRKLMGLFVASLVLIIVCIYMTAAIALAMTQGAARCEPVPQQVTTPASPTAPTNLVTPGNAVAFKARSRSRSRSGGSRSSSRRNRTSGFNSDNNNGGSSNFRDIDSNFRDTNGNRFFDNSRSFTSRRYRSCPTGTRRVAKAWILNMWDPTLLLTVAAITTSIVGTGSLYKTQQLKAGGAVIATELGGTLIAPEDATPEEQELLNIVEEMAIAAGVPIPQVYLLDQEQGINAFAAGNTPSDAVIGVTRGTLEQLTRDELQGVIGHEFSHILNGDMRLNLRMVGLIHGLVLIYFTGRIVAEFRSRDEKGNAMLFFGFGLIAIGLIGAFCGNLIRSAISRQREFLADAAAVQFTRNPEGIAGALRKIGGYEHGTTLRSPHAEIHSHMLFGDGHTTFLDGWLASHPPLAERIRRIENRADLYLERAEAAGVPSVRPSAEMSPGVMGFAAGGAATATTPKQSNPLTWFRQAAPDFLPIAQSFVPKLTPTLQTALTQPKQATAVVFALLLDSTQAEIHTKQLAWLRHTEAADFVEHILHLETDLATLTGHLRLPLTDLAVPALRQLPTEQQPAFFKTIQALAKADGQWSISEFTVYTLLEHRFSATPVTGEQTAIAPLWNDCLILISALARAGQTGKDAVTEILQHSQ
ncbi:MAG TPA: M48 family metallopeptidase [Leptolyngbyaceae cyanobacterium M33_DOE_097]|uniref:Transcriptional regulator n=1 Tax=Oscillatoriales cyanobacterium SpSt-418 TaxID=2282169 RepID=A0A7C3KBN9_9CYAN|nr:M48 family metallopeptidase [Leptolyngbyaceae cyanobacterium M33_DOE_097]